MTSPERGRQRELGFIRAPDLVKNIQRTSPSQRSFEPFPSTNASRHTSKSGRSTAYAADSRESMSSRFKHPMNAYNNDATFETIVPNHTNMLHQKYQSNAQGSQARIQPQKRESISLQMDGDLVPAFDEMQMEFDDDRDDKSGYSITRSSETDTASVPEGTFEIIHNGAHQTGRIQQRITALKALQEHDDQGWRQGFSNIEQKTLLNSLNNELQTLRRSNYRPLLQSVQRLDQRAKEEEQITKAYSAIPIDYPKRREPQLDKLKILLTKSSQLVESLWVDEPRSNKSSTSTDPSQMSYPNAMTIQTIQNDGYHHLNDFEGFQLNKKSHLGSHISEHSPRTVV